MEYKYFSDCNTEGYYCFECNDNTYMIKKEHLEEPNSSTCLTLISDDAGHKKIKEVLIGNYKIPTYQRGYRWDSQNVIKLLEDIYEGKLIKDFQPELKSKIKGESEYEFLKHHVFDYATLEVIEKYKYCIQPFVMMRRGRNNEYDVVDGQQRLTTIGIILSALKLCKVFYGKGIKDNLNTASISYSAREGSQDMLEFLWQISDSLSEDELKNIINIDEIKEASNISEISDFIENNIFSEKLLEYFENKSKKFKPNIDFDHILNSFKVAVYFFVKMEEDFTKEFRINYVHKYYDYLYFVLTNCTEVIWYVIDRDCESFEKIDERKIFANFNTGKLPLTNAELIKAIFMNPSNYGAKDNGELIKDRQIVISEKWDAIETELHNPDFWAFVPHPNQYNINSENGERYNETRIDVIFDFLVMKNWIEENNGSVEEYIYKNNENFLDQYYTFNKIDNWIINKLEAANSSNDDSSICIAKREIMDKCWDEVRSIFTCIKEFYEDDGRNSKVSSKLYNLVGFYIYACNMKKDDNTFYISTPERNNTKRAQNNTYLKIFKLIDELSQQPRKKRENWMRGRIREVLGLGNSNKEQIGKFIKSIRYGDNGRNGDKIAILLLFYNIALLNRSGGIGNRFHFSEYAKQIWEREHIFAQNEDYLNNSNLIQERRAALKSLAEGINEENEEGLKKNGFLQYVNYIYSKEKDYCPILYDENNEEELIEFNNKVNKFIDKYKSTVGYEGIYRKVLLTGRKAQIMNDTYDAIGHAEKIIEIYDNEYPHLGTKLDKFNIGEKLKRLIVECVAECSSTIFKNIKINENIMENYFTNENIRSNLVKLENKSDYYIYSYDKFAAFIEDKLNINPENSLKRRFKEFKTEAVDEEDRINDFKQWLNNEDEKKVTKRKLIHLSIERLYKKRFKDIFEYILIDGKAEIATMINMNEDFELIKKAFIELVNNKSRKVDKDGEFDDEDDLESEENDIVEDNDLESEENDNSEDNHLEEINSIDDIKKKIIINDYDLEFIINAMKNSLIFMNKKIDDFFRDEYTKELNDDSMGNFALLSKEINILVSKKPYYEKSELIYKRYKMGSFIPLGTILVFTDLYTKDVNSATQWLPESRLRYLEDLVGTVTEYLGGEML